VQLIVLFKADDFLQLSRVLLELPFHVMAQFRVHVIWTFADKSQVEYQQNCFLCATHKPKAGQFRPSVLQRLQRNCIHLFHFIPDVPISEEHSSGQLSQLQSPLPLELYSHYSPIDHCQFRGAIFVLPVEGLAEGQVLHSGKHGELSH
jgi:hypothetical protein